MDLKNRTQIIGLGNAGGKIAKLFADAGYTSMFCNGSDQDIANLGNAKGIYKLNGYDGFGGDRHLACQALTQNTEILAALKNISAEIVVIIYAAGGSTGSGLSTVVAQYLIDAYSGEKIICMVPILPAETESIGKHSNAYEAIQELLQLDTGASMVIDNSKGNSNLRQINGRFFTLFDEYLTNDSTGERNNFDGSERLALLRESGSMIIASSLDKVKDGGIFATPQNDGVCGQIGIIHKGKTAEDIKADEVIGVLGKPYNISEGFSGGKTLIAASGLSYPISQVTKLGKLAMDGQSERIRRAEASNSIELPDLGLGNISAIKKPKKPESKKLAGYEALMALN